MAIKYHPKRGSIVICDFSGFHEPEMTKRRPVVVISPRLKHRPKLCTIIALSTSDPRIIRPYHHKLCLTPPLPSPYSASCMWVKGDMIYSVSFERLSLLFDGRKKNGKRNYIIRQISKEDLAKVEICVVNGLGIKNID